jgi:hypothetical protein
MRKGNVVAILGLKVACTTSPTWGSLLGKRYVFPSLALTTNGEDIQVLKVALIWAWVKFDVDERRRINELSLWNVSVNENDEVAAVVPVRVKFFPTMFAKSPVLVGRSCIGDAQIFQPDRVAEPSETQV